MIKLYYEFKCAECGLMSIASFLVSLDPRFEVARPSVPSGWTYAEGNLYCGQHDVTVKVKVEPKKLRCWHCGRTYDEHFEAFPARQTPPCGFLKSKFLADVDNDGAFRRGEAASNACSNRAQAAL